MDYAEKILQKYGWKKGKGLGKHEKGISKPLKCGLKFDKSGIGYNEKVSKEDNNQWWIQMFNQAASNIPSDNLKKEDNKKNDSAVAKLLTDEELFEACGGRTAHKAARHGFKLNGKLKRVRHQECENKIDEPVTECININDRKRKKKKSKSESIDQEVSRTKKKEKRLRN